MSTELKEQLSNLQIAIETGQFPRYAYKYRPIDEHTEEIFTNSEIWFANPLTFNDPFDCQLVPANRFEKSDIKNFLEHNKPDVRRKEFRQKLNYYSRHKDKLSTIINNILRETAFKSGVSCFAGSNDNILMWSHYAHSHNGICIKFDILQSLELFLFPIVVKYTEKYPIYNHLIDASNIVDFLFKTKSKCWEYENEIRVIKPRSGYYKFNHQSIVEICFGCNVSNDDINKYKQILSSNHFNHVEFLKAEPSKKEFKIEFVTL